MGRISCWSSHTIKNLFHGSQYFVITMYFVFYSRTLTAVHNAILDDLCYPAEIVGKRTRVKLDGSHLIKVHLDKNQQTNVEHKV